MEKAKMEPIAYDVESPYCEELDWAASPVCIIEVGKAREIMLNVTDGDVNIWKDLLRREWGGHYHRVLLQLACSDSADEQSVNITPLYLEERMRDFSNAYEEIDAAAEWKRKLHMRSACLALWNEMEESSTYGYELSSALYRGLANHQYDEVSEVERHFIYKERQLLEKLANGIASLLEASK